MYNSMGINRRKAMNDMVKRVKIPKVSNKNYCVYGNDKVFDYDIDDDDFYEEEYAYNKDNNLEDCCQCDCCDEQYDENYDYDDDYGYDDNCLCDCYRNMDTKKVIFTAVGVIAGIAAISIFAARRR